MAWLTAWKQRLLYVCYRVDLRRFRSKWSNRVGISRVPKLRSAGVPPFGTGRCWPLKHLFLYANYHAEFGRSRWNLGQTQRTQKSDPVLWDRACLTPWKLDLPPRGLSCGIWSLLVKRYKRTYMRYAGKLSPLRPVFQGQGHRNWRADRSGTHDFLLTFYTNHGPIPRRDNGRTLWIFLHPCTFI